jgi:hypothetical protein
MRQRPPRPVQADRPGRRRRRGQHHQGQLGQGKGLEEEPAGINLYQVHELHYPMPSYEAKSLEGSYADTQCR